jgi:hypothetical protein
MEPGRGRESHSILLQLDMRERKTTRENQKEDLALPKI